MRVMVLGAGIVGVSTAWYLQARGHEVVLVDRQADAALETSYANGAQISVSFCEPWAGAWVPFKVLKWLTRDDSPLLFRPRLELAQMRYGLAFLRECTTASFERNVEELVQLGRYSHARLKELVIEAGIEYERLEKGILHFFSNQSDLDKGAAGAEVMRRHGVDRRVLTRDEVLAVEPALASFGPNISGGTFTPSDESGDALVFTQKLARLCEQRGMQARWNTHILALEKQGGQLSGVRVRTPEGRTETLQADAYVVALASYAPALVNPVAECLNIYPAKGYSATLKLKQPDKASTVSLLDDTRKIAISRLGDRIRIAGTAELVGLDTSLSSATSQVRCHALVKRYEELFPGVADTSEPNFWTGLRPSTPTNIPYIGRSKRLANLWFNCGHGTLGWTHGAGSGHALADLISGRKPETAFNFYGS